MNHPILSNKRALSTYLAVWVICALVQSTILVLKTPVTLETALVDCLLYWGVFGVLGLIIWYVVCYNNLENRPFAFIALHLVVGVVATAILVFKNWALSSFFLSMKVDFQIYFKQTVFFRFFNGLFSYAVMLFFYYMVIYRERNKEITM